MTNRELLDHCKSKVKCTHRCELDNNLCERFIEAYGKAPRYIIKSGTKCSDEWFELEVGKESKEDLK